MLSKADEEDEAISDDATGFCRRYMMIGLLL